MHASSVRADPGGDRKAVTIPFTYTDNRMMIRCVIDGRGPFVMVVDTGSPDVTITPEIAKTIGASVRDAGVVRGAGNKPAHIGSTRLRSLSIGSLSFTGIDAGVVDLTEIRTKLHFSALDGIIGYAVLKNFATYVNVDDATISFERTRPAVPPNATATSFRGILPIIPARVDGIATSVVVDTGDRSSMTLFTPFAKQHSFYGRYPSKHDIVTGFGLGGPVYADVFTLPSLDVLGTHFSAVVTRASRQTGGVFAGTDQGGSIGTGILKRFNVVYDYPHHAIVAWPSKYFNAPDRFVSPTRSL